MTVPLYRLCLAPMVGVTTAPARYFFRLISPQLTVFTEMVSAKSLLRRRRDGLRLLQRGTTAAPVVAQLAVNDASEAAAAAKLIADAGFDAINLNVGCPSKAAQQMGCGVVLMRQPHNVADCIRAIADTTGVPPSVKCRIGVDDDDNDAFVDNFITTITDAGCQTVIIHARIALLRGLNPKQNRHVPPIRYAAAYRIKQNMPSLQLIINGEITTVADATAHLHHVDGIMIGRQFDRQPMFAGDCASALFAETPPSLEMVLDAYFRYILSAHDSNQRLSAVFLLKPLFGVCYGQPYAAQWRRLLTTMMATNSIDIDALTHFLYTTRAHDQYQTTIESPAG